MRRLLPALIFVALPLAQGQRKDSQAVRNTELLLERLAAAAHLNLEPTDMPVHPPRPNWSMEMVSSVAAAPDGMIYALQRGAGADPVVAINPQGRVVRSWGAGLYSIPHSIRVDPDGNVWTVDAGSSVVYKFSSEGKTLLRIDVGEMPEKESPFRGASDIAFAPDGNLLIADGYGNARILEYTAQGKRVRQFGRRGTGPGEFNLPHAVAIDERGIIYVGDRENGRIQRFSRDGKHLSTWDGLGKTYSLHLEGDAIWLGSHRLDQANGSPGWLMKLDRNNGRILGVVESTGTHSVTLNPAGEPFTGTRPDRILHFRTARP